MASGGSRARSGPLPKETSGRSDKRGYKLAELPAKGYTGRAPKFPLPDASPRELEVWTQLWKTPQACAWSLPSEQWRHRIVGMYVRQSVKCEAQDVGAGQIAQLHRFADQVGLTDAGLAAMGWKVAKEESRPPVARGRASSRDRLHVVQPDLSRLSSLERARLRMEEAQDRGNDD